MNLRRDNGIGFLDAYDYWDDGGWDVYGWGGGGYDDFVVDWDDWGSWGSDFSPSSGDDQSWWLDAWDTLWPGWDEDPVITIDSERCSERWSPACTGLDPDYDIPFYPALYDPGSLGPTFEDPGIPPPPGLYDPYVAPWLYDPGPYVPTFEDPGVPPAPTPQLPGYCPAGTYHPIDNPFACVPFPPGDPRARQQQQQQQQQRPQPRPGASSASSQQKPPAQKCPQGQVFNTVLQRCIPQCQKGQVFNAMENRCMTPPQCAQNLKFNPYTGQCANPSTIPKENKDNSWLWLLLIGGGLLLATSGKKNTSGRGRR